METIGALLMIPVFILLLIMAVMAFLMPYYVWKIAKGIDTNNRLQRQLLRAYGHTPEA
jgi:hypothetical protein